MIDDTRIQAENQKMAPDGFFLSDEKQDDLLHLENVQDEVDLGRKAFALAELEILLPIIRRAIESGDTSELEEWAR